MGPSRAIRLVGAAGALYAALACPGGSVAQSPPPRAAAVAVVAAEYAALRSDFPEGSARTIDSDARVLRRGHALVERGMDRVHADAAAERIFRTIDLYERLPGSRELLDHMADSAYAYRSLDTSVADLANFTLAVGTLELVRGDYLAASLLTDSVLATPPPRMRLHTRATAYLIRGFANERLARPQEAYADFLAAAGAYERDPESSPSKQIEALKEASEVAIALDRRAEAIALSTEALRRVGAPAATASLRPGAYHAYASNSEALLAFGRYDEALAAAERALELARRRPRYSSPAEAQWRLGRIYLALGELDRAGVALHSALAGFRSRGATPPIAACYASLVELRTAQGRHAEALAYERTRHAIIDSVAAVSRDLRLADLRQRHSDARLHHELALARAEAAVLEAASERGRTQRLALGLLLVVVGCAVALLTTRLRARRRYQRVLEAEVADRTADLEARTAELDRQTKELRRSNVELERFAYIASHDLKTPVRNVASFAGLAERRLAADAPTPEALDEAREYLGIVLGYAARMDALVTDILAFSRLDAEVAEGSIPVEVHGLLARLAQRLTPELTARNATLEMSGRAVVTAPESHLERLFTNLITNAVTYNQSPFPRVQVAIRTEGEVVSVAVRDNGIGIEPEFHERVFELFRRLHGPDDYAGSGLGLATCRKVAERLGGSIELESAPGEGSCFTVTLPVDCRTELAVAAP